MHLAIVHCFGSMSDRTSSSILHDTSSTRAQSHLHFDYAVNGFVGSVNWACAHANAYGLLPIRALQAYCCCWQSHCAADNLTSPQQRQTTEATVALND